MKNTVDPLMTARRTDTGARKAIRRLFVLAIISFAVGIVNAVFTGLAEFIVLGTVPFELSRIADAWLPFFSKVLTIVNYFCTFGCIIALFRLGRVSGLYRTSGILLICYMVSYIGASFLSWQIADDLGPDFPILIDLVSTLAAPTSLVAFYLELHGHMALVKELTPTLHAPWKKLFWLNLTLLWSEVGVGILAFILYYVALPTGISAFWISAIVLLVAWIAYAFYLKIRYIVLLHKTHSAFTVMWEPPTDDVTELYDLIGSTRINVIVPREERAEVVSAEGEPNPDGNN